MHRSTVAAVRAAVSICLGATLLGGCATVMNGTNQDYRIASDPDGAKVTLSNGVECVTPCKVELRRGNDLRADFAKEGHKPAYVLIQSKTGGATFGNILAGGVIGAVVDSSNGSNNFLSPRPLHVKMVSRDSAEAAQLLDKQGKATGTVDAHNAAVREKVVASLGRKLAGYEDAAVSAAVTPAAPEQGEAPAVASDAVPAATEGASVVPATDAGEAAPESGSVGQE